MMAYHLGYYCSHELADIVALNCSFSTGKVPSYWLNASSQDTCTHWFFPIFGLSHPQPSSRP